MDESGVKANLSARNLCRLPVAEVKSEKLKNQTNDEDQKKRPQYRFFESLRKISAGKMRYR